MSLGISIDPWKHHHICAINLSITPKSFLPALIIIIFVIWTLKIYPFSKF